MHKPPNRNTVGSVRSHAPNASSSNQKTKLKKPSDSNSRQKPQVDQHRIALEDLHRHSLSESAKSSLPVRTKVSLSRQPLTSKRPSILEAEDTDNHSKIRSNPSIPDTGGLSFDPYEDTDFDIFLSNLPEEEVHFSFSSSDSSPVTSPVVKKRTSPSISLKTSKRLKADMSATQATSFIDLSPSPPTHSVLGLQHYNSPSKHPRSRSPLFMSSPSFSPVDRSLVAASSAKPHLTTEFRKISHMLSPDHSSPRFRVAEPSAIHSATLASTAVIEHDTLSQVLTQPRDADWDEIEEWMATMVDIVDSKE